ncbi:hypothetical protein HNQ82_001235 [Anoxybacillus tengchongensis]|uniref:Uncharacterized protein n=1 Tax=Anoxybacillus tengchongensis TaxID=576944 RepID=A0A7X0DA46_9BACL|nr:hypothetical protein [Anoxybacillus tengchongensis]MBB6176421.1 hypothetical protein [Anoxybacillus tengchongensis]
MDKKTMNEIPALLQERVDLKALTARVFVNSIEGLKNGKIKDVSIDPNTEILFFTHFGVVSGSLYNPPDDEFDPVYSLHEVILKARDSLLSSYIEDGVKRMVNDKSFVLLKDVTIKPYANNDNSYKLAYFVLYSDAILGLSFGNQPKDQHVNVAE